MARMHAELPRIWLITDPGRPDGPVPAMIRALERCPPGLVGITLRAKEATDRELVTWGHALRAATAEAGALLTVNRRPDVAAIVGADGIHLPERALSPDAIRAAFPDIGLVGTSRHDRMGLAQAASEGASFAFLSPLFPVPDKGEPIGIEAFAEAIAGVDIPTYALGGIAVEHVRAVVEAGARGVAVRRAIYEAREPAETLAALLDELDNALPRGE